MAKILGRINLDRFARNSALFKMNPFLTRYKHGDYRVWIRSQGKADPGRDMKRIAVFSGPGMGDQLVMTPAIKLLKEKHPKAEVSYLVKEQHAPLFEGLPFIDRVVPLKLEGERRDFAKYYGVIKKALEGRAFDLIFFHMCMSEAWGDFWNKFGNTVKVASVDPYISIKECPGLDHHVLGEKINSVSAYAGYLWGLLPLSSIWGGLTWLSGIREEDVRPYLSGRMLEGAQPAADSIFNGINREHPVIFFNPVGALMSRTLSQAQASQMVDILLQKYPKAFVFINGGTGAIVQSSDPRNCMSERALTELITDGTRADKKRVRLLPQVDLPGLVQVMHMSSAIITVDTGISHIAYSDIFADKPCLTIYPDIASESVWSVRGRNVHTMIAQKKLFTRDSSNPMNVPIGGFIDAVESLLILE